MSREYATGYLTKPGSRDPSKAWPPGDPSYQAAHLRVKAIRGKASWFPCLVCGYPARDWSYNHMAERELVARLQGFDMPYSADIEDYDPLCKPCHKIRDENR